MVSSINGAFAADEMFSESWRKIFTFIALIFVEFASNAGESEFNDNASKFSSHIL